MKSSLPRPFRPRSVTAHVHLLIGVIAVVAIATATFILWTQHREAEHEDRINAYHLGTVRHLAAVTEGLGSMRLQLALHSNRDSGSPSNGTVERQREESLRAIRSAVEVIEKHCKTVEQLDQRYDNWLTGRATARLLEKTDRLATLTATTDGWGPLITDDIVAQVEYAVDRCAQLRRLHVIAFDEGLSKLQGQKTSSRRKLLIFLALTLLGGSIVVFRLLKSINEIVQANKTTAQELRRLVHHDNLTGLHNRSGFLENLKRSVERAKRVDNYGFALLFLDFDRFKLINDTLGHEVGDQFLRQVGQRLQGLHRANDLAGRMGGDEFVVLLDGVLRVDDAITVATRLQQQLSMPFKLEQNTVSTTVSIGIALSQGDYECAMDIMRDADLAMYRAKANGRNGQVVFDEQMRRCRTEQVQTQRELVRAVQEGVFEARFDPVVSVEHGVLRGFEASVRWRRGASEVLEQKELLALGIETGLFDPIWRWLLREACCNWQKWQQRCSSDSPLCVTLPTCVAQLRDAEFVGGIEQIMGELSVPPEILKLDLPENTFADGLVSTRPTLQSLADLGVGLTIADFGTGHATLRTLHQIPVNEVKICHAHVTGAENDRGYSALVYAAITVAHNLNLRVVATGVETVEQFVQLQVHGCDLAQGSVFTEPLNAQQAEQLVDAPNTMIQALAANTKT